MKSCLDCLEDQWCEACDVSGCFDCFEEAPGTPYLAGLCEDCQLAVFSDLEEDE